MPEKYLENIDDLNFTGTHFENQTIKIESDSVT
ncbi:hypothetical protein J2128_002242 [Methanomicrobium sp. W14]|nr:hypothetical protein [Methanomicrobium sp. W14]